MAPAPEEKMEAMLICLTAINMDLKTVDHKRLTELLNILTGENLTTNAVKCRWRAIKVKARELLDMEKNNTPIDGEVLASPKPKTQRKPKTPDGVKAGRVAKSKVAKSPSKLSAAELLEDEGDDVNVKSEVKQETDNNGWTAVNKEMSLTEM